MIIKSRKVFDKLNIILIIFVFMNISFSVKLASHFYIPYYENKPVLIDKNLPKIFYSESNYYIGDFSTDSNHLRIHGWIYDMRSNKAFEKIYLVFENSKNEMYKIDLDKKERPDVANHFKNQKLHNSGFDDYINIGKMNIGKYQVYFLIEINRKPYFIKTNKELEIEFYGYKLYKNVYFSHFGVDVSSMFGK
jgi:hypothetical protein